MLNPLQKFSTWMSCCLSCGSFWTDTGFICSDCRKILNKHSQSLSHEVNGLKVHSLYDWVPQQSDALSRLLLHTKKANFKAAWSQNAQWLLKKPSVQTEILSCNRPLFVIPAPPKIKNSKDHGYSWGKALSVALGAEFVPCLRRSLGQIKEQKRSSLNDRTNIQLEVDENYSEWPSDLKEGLWLFADDIVTTGSTALAAHRALGQPKQFQVMALGYRRLSCGRGKNLL